MAELSLLSRIALYVLLAFYGVFALIVLFWQIRILKGHSFANPDGSKDDWHEQPTHYGIAVADVLVACPTNLIGIALVFLRPRWGFYLLALASFWWVWANVMTTATSLRFHDPRKAPVMWFISFPLGILLGLAFIAWTVVHFDVIYLP